MKITEITKRNIFDELTASDARVINWHGRLDEIKFLQRLYKLNELPTTDARVDNMEGDIYAHRYANNDWNDWWIIDDERLGLFSDDDKFIKFLCEMIHPVVRNNQEEIEYILDIFNRYLKQDGIEVVSENEISGRPIFNGKVIGRNNIILENEGKFTREFAIEQLNKCDKKIKSEDYDGAITNSRSLLEDVFADIYYIIKNEELKKCGDLKDDYKEIKKLLRLSPEKHTNDNVKQIINSFVSIIDGIDRLSNQMGDRHRRLVKPERHHAKLCVNSAKVIIDFLYDTVDFQIKRRDILVQALFDILNSPKAKRVANYETFKNYIRSFSREELLKEEKVIKFISLLDEYQHRIIIDELINNFEVKGYNDNNVFFCSLYIVFDSLNDEDIKKIKLKLADNNQAYEMEGFLDIIKKEKPQLLKE